MTSTPWARFFMPHQYAPSVTGAPLPGAKLYFFASGTATPLTTYSDAALTIPNTNPVIADNAGVFGDIFLQSLSYKVRLTDTDDDEVWTADPVAPTPTPTSTYDLPFYVQGIPVGGEVYPIFNIDRALRLPANLVGGVFTCNLLPTADCAWTLYKNGSANGLITFAAGTGLPTVSFANNVDFASGDQFSQQYQSVADVTAGAFSFTHLFTIL